MDSGNKLPEAIGGNILGLITSGMYTSPLSIYREYIQNAADSIAFSGQRENGKVEISTHLDSMSLSIRDNGPGLSHAQAIKELIPIAKSNKDRQTDRGFRGIGRLAGLAFGESVTFLTRSKGTGPVTQIVWNGSRLRNIIDNGLSAEKTISACVTIDTVKGDIYPPQFFEVRIDGISRYAASCILNQDLVREYIGKVCTVPFSKNFPYTRQVLDLFEEGEKPFTLNVLIDNNKNPVTRPHGNDARFSEKSKNLFVGFEEIFIPALEGERNAAVGWIAHSFYSGALPQKPSIRCMRARVGNIQIGDENIFDHLFFRKPLQSLVYIRNSYFGPSHSTKCET